MPEKTEKDQKLTLRKLAEHNGTEGKAAYVAFQGKVYDVSASGLWQGGQHMAQHQAGKDLSEEFEEAPHGQEVFERYHQVGIIKEEPQQPEESIAAPGAREFWRRALRRAPLLRRHPHPMLVHFPIAFMTSSTAFTILSLLTGTRSLEVTGFHCLAGGLLFTPPVIATGLFTWWLNYESRFLRPVVNKLILSPLLLAVATGLFIWRWLNPAILNSLEGWPSLVYLALICSLSPLAGIIGWYGAKLTFPLPGD